MRWERNIINRRKKIVYNGLRSAERWTWYGAYERRENLKFCERTSRWFGRGCFISIDVGREEFTGDKYMDIYFSCEGDIYERYACGTDERAKKVRNVIDSLSDKYDLP